MSIRLKELYEQVRARRSDLIPEQISNALVEAARKLAADTKLLRDTVLFTLEEDDYSLSPELPNGREIDSFLKVELWDNDLAQWVKLTGPCALRVDGDDIEGLDSATPSAWGGLNGLVTVDAPADDTYAMRAKVAYIPGRIPIPDVLDFPPKAEAALIAWAKHLILEISGPGQDLKSAHAEETRYHHEVSPLCAIAHDGEGVSRSLNDFLPQE